MSAAAGWLESSMLSCPSKSWFGLDCPGCGVQRSFAALIHGDLGESLRLYPALIPILLLFVTLFTGLKWDFPYRLTVLKSLFFLSVFLILGNYFWKMAHGQLGEFHVPHFMK